jgi:hypothetical protein
VKILYQNRWDCIRLNSLLERGLYFGCVVLLYASKANHLEAQDFSPARYDSPIDNGMNKN